MSNKTYLAVTVTVIFLAGLGFGFSLDDAWQSRTINTSTREQTLSTALQQSRVSTTSPAGNFRVLVNGASRDYAAIVISASHELLQNYRPNIPLTEIQGGAEYTAVKQRTQAIGQALVAVIGPANRQALEANWTAQSTAILTYTTSLAAGDQNGIAKAVADLNSANQQIAKLLNRWSTKLNNSTIQAALDRGSLAIRDAINAIKTGQNSTYYAQQQLATEQFGLFADIVSQGLVAAAPQNF